MYIQYLVAVISILLAAASVVCSEPLNVRVGHKNGVPQILVNNKPVRARVFYGQPAAGLLALTEQPQLVQFELTPMASTDKSATMHFRFSQTPGDIYLDDITVTDLTTGEVVLPPCQFENGYDDFTREWNIWPPPDRNNVGTVTVEPGVGSNGSAGLHIHIVAPPNGVWPDFHIHHNPDMTLNSKHRYKVSFWEKATPKRDLNLSFYKPGTTYMFLGGPSGHYESQVKLAAGAGVNFVSASIDLPWPAPGKETDWTMVDSVCDITFRSNPNALLIPRIPVYAPSWWMDAHPDELMRWEKDKNVLMASPASEIFKKEASERLEILIKHLEEKYGNHIAGYHPCGQNTGEWFYMDSWERALNGYSPCDTAAFRNWLQKRYSSVEKLRKAWSDDAVDFTNAQVPSAEARHSSPGGIFRDPVKERPIIDFVKFQQDSMADSVCQYARVVRKTTNGQKLVLFFYGYVFEFGPISTGSGSSGHYALSKVLTSPDIDILCSPISYFDRGRGQSAPCMTAAESVVLAKKMWLTEDDTRTYLTKEETFPGAEHVLKNAEETNQLLTRNVAQESMRNFATWWMDLGATGWFDDPKMWERMKLLENIDLPMLRKPVPYKPEVAVVIDERSMMRLSDGGDTAGKACVYVARAAFARSGAPYGQYLLDDVIKGKVHAKLYIFTSAWCLDAKQRAALRKATKGSVCIWSYAPGYFDNYTESLKAMQELTGFNLVPAGPVNAMATPAANGAKIGKAFGVEKAIKPLFAVKGAKPKEILVAYPDGSTAVAMRKSPNGTSIFVGPPGFTPALVRFAAKKAGVHLYTEQDCNVYANGPFLALHAPKDGTYKINTGSKTAIIDVLTGKKIGKGPVLDLPMKYSETRILRIK